MPATILNTNGVISFTRDPRGGTKLGFDSGVRVWIGHECRDAHRTLLRACWFRLRQHILTAGAARIKPLRAPMLPMYNGKFGGAPLFVASGGRAKAFHYDVHLFHRTPTESGC